MPYCPKCKAEYRAGFKRCTDCNTELVSELKNEERVEPVDPVGKVKLQPELSDEVSVLTVINEVQFVYITSAFEQENIPYRVMEEGVGQYLTIYFGSSYMGKTIYVGKDNYKTAIEIVQSFDSSLVKDDENNQ